ncbi:VOC family protein [Ureibacillus acetophenoni]|uniref:Glyoxalase-like protein n=1 Tax=Ureibacillus acetophenoni TaxID=614649 RepID=A0A285U6Q1_9BACL|nr:VOC family protein [Ureibacillus acetophenoni]SOC37512.1 glyoxalase-like protein [Ureibacillus acetophenoni]
MYKLDHIVHFVDKPETLIDQLSNVGVHTVLGGKHEMWGTYNTLSYFQDLSYIEFIGIFDQQLFKKSAREPFTLHETYEKRQRKNGFNRIALRTNTIDEDAKKLKEAQFLVYGPQVFSRKRPDGTVITWKLLHFGKKDQEIDYPFLIEWDRKDEERYEELVSSGSVSKHPLGELKIDSIVFKVNDLEKISQWARLFNFQIESSNKLLKMELPNTILFFYFSENNVNNIEEVIISGANKEKIVEIENAKYKFIL